MSLNIAILAAGAGDMFCGSCLRDHALASALVRAGQRVSLVPMYTPLRTETAGDESVGSCDVFFGGVNVYLQHASALFRHTPRAIDSLLDRPGLLKLAGRFATSTSPAQLGPLTISILQGEGGPARKELRRLAHFLKTEVRPDIVSLPNLMFIGLAPMLRRELGAKIVCELTGEDLFLGQLAEPYRSQAHEIIRQRAPEVTQFVATSHYYAQEMSHYAGVDRSRIAVVHPSVPNDYVIDQVAPRPETRAPTIGYVARICPDKGFGQFVEIVRMLRNLPRMSDARALAGGFLGGGDRSWFEQVMHDAPGVTYVGELNRQSKLDLLDSIDVLCVPTIYAEAKGIYLLEAMARGVPVVQPAHGSFPELLELTGGGTLVPPGDARACAELLASQLRDPTRRAELGRAGRDAIEREFTHDHMGAKMLDVYRQLS